MFGHMSFGGGFQGYGPEQNQGMFGLNIGDILGQIGRDHTGRVRQRPQPMPHQPPQRHLTDPPKMPGSPTQQQPTSPSPMAPAIMGNPFTPLSSQPITFGSMLSRQPIY